MMKRSAVLFLAAILASCSNGDISAPISQPEGSTPVVPKSTVIAHGGAYDKSDYLIPGKIVILDFYADW